MIDFSDMVWDGNEYHRYKELPYENTWENMDADDQDMAIRLKNGDFSRLDEVRTKTAKYLIELNVPCDDLVQFIHEADCVNIITNKDFTDMIKEALKHETVEERSKELRDASMVISWINSD